MGGGAADQGQASVDPRLGPAVVDHRREPPPRLLRQRHGLPEMAALPIPDEILAEIFLRLPTPADLVRASGACVSFRRVAAARSFVRRFRKLHAPLLLGFLDKYRTFYPAISPHPSAPAASATALAADFSFSFLPAPARDWVVQDSRDGRFLLDRPRLRDASDHRVPFTEMVVCDPLHRRYLLLPPIPDDLAASVENPILKDPRSSETFLVPRCEDDEAVAAEETSFRVIWMSQCKFKLFAFVFSSSTGQWQAIPSQSWNDMFAGLLPWICLSVLQDRQYVYGCFYWETGRDEHTKMVVLDTRMMEFSITTPPPYEAKLGLGVAMVEAGEGRPGIVLLAHAMSDLRYSIRQNDGGSSSQWQMEKTISLSSEYSFRVIGSVGRYLFLHRWQSSIFDLRALALDIKTFQLQEVCHAPKLCKLDVYINFPPSVLSPPTISNGVENEAEEMLEQVCAASSSAYSPGLE